MPAVATTAVPVRTADLRRCSPLETLVELSLPLPWLALALFATSHGWYPLTALASFYFFLTGLRVSHNAFHGALGLSARATDAVLVVLSVAMLGALHAVRTTHLVHHRHCMDERDVEGRVGRVSAARALLAGPAFAVAIHVAGWREATRAVRAWIVLELAANAAWLATVWLLSDVPALRVHTLLMVGAYSLSAFFAVWSVHRGCGPRDGARTLRSRWKSRLSYAMFFHDEHHRYPAIPTCHLGELARRLDAAGRPPGPTVW